MIMDKKPLPKLQVILSHEVDPTAEGQSLESAVDEDIAAFADYFCGELKNDSLSKPERAILKTYLWWKTHGQAQIVPEQDSNLRGSGGQSDLG